jgi:hypothetical protein
LGLDLLLGGPDRFESDLHQRARVTPLIRSVDPPQVRWGVAIESLRPRHRGKGAAVVNTTPLAIGIAQIRGKAGANAVWILDLALI